jgi:cell division protein FtsI (penicillin-binding protein 3)
MSNNAKRIQNIYLAQEGLSLFHRLCISSLIFVILIGGVLFRHTSIISNNQTYTPINLSKNTSENFIDPCGILSSSTRGTILDRNGEILAISRQSFNLYIRKNSLPKENAVHIAKRLSSIIQGVSSQNVIAALTENTRDMVIKTRALQDDIDIIEALHVADSLKQRIYWNKNLPLESRYYPKQNLTSQVIGRVTLPKSTKQLTSHSQLYINNHYKKHQLYGINGIEKENDCLLRDGITLHSTLDIRLQNIIKNTLSAQKKLFRAKQAGGLLLDIQSGDILALVSLPDFNPNTTRYLGHPQYQNIITQQRFEIGSVFKIINFAIAFEHQNISFSQSFNIAKTLRASASQSIIRDYRPKKNILSFQEVFTHSSNIGSALIARQIPLPFYTEKLNHLGVLSPPLVSGLPPILSTKHHISSQITPNQRDYISHGYGIEITPLHLATVIANLLNHEKPIYPSVLNPSLHPPLEKPTITKSILSPPSIQALLYLLKKNVLEGTGKGAYIENFPLGGKTGSANKINTSKTHDGKKRVFYDSQKRLASFLALFPVQKPQYLLFFIFDEPIPKTKNGFATGGTVAAPVAKMTTLRIHSLLNLTTPTPSTSITAHALSIPREFQ